jgi:tripeptide aminopeptidase
MTAPIDRRLIETFLAVAAIDGLSGNERDVAQFIGVRLAALGLSLHEDDAAQASGGNSGNLIARAGDGGHTVLLAHMDTARSTAGMRPVLRADRITSDGTSVLGVDDRAGVAALLHAVERVMAVRGEAARFSLAFTICEETTLAGSRHLAIDPAWKHGFVFDSSQRPGRFIAGSYGCKRFCATVQGRAAHSGIAPERGIDAVRVLAAAISALPLGRIDAETTANVGLMHGGSALNVVPDRAQAEGEIRATTTPRVEQIDAEFTATFASAARVAGATVDYQSHWEFEPYRHDPASSLYARTVELLRATGLNPEPYVTPGGSDANALNARGLAAMNLGIGAQNPHGNDEFILLEDLAAAAAIAERLLLES